MKEIKHKRTPQHIVDKIKSMEKAGFSKTNISKELNVVISVVANYTERTRRNMNESDRSRISELYLQGKTQIEIGKIVGFSRDAVARVTKDLPKRKKPHKQNREPKTKPSGVPIPKIKKLKAVIRKEKVNNLGKEVNVRKLETKPRPPVYKKIRLDSKTEIETYSEAEYLEKVEKYGMN